MFCPKILFKIDLMLAYSLPATFACSSVLNSLELMGNKEKDLRKKNWEKERKRAREKRRAREEKKSKREREKRRAREKERKEREKEEQGEKEKERERLVSTSPYSVVLSCRWSFTMKESTVGLN